MARGLNGTTDRIDYTCIDATAGQAQSFSALVYVDDAPADDERILEQHQVGDGTYAIVLQLSANRTFQFIGNTDDATLKSYSDQDKIPLAQWFHLFVTWDGSLTAANVHTYINNVEVTYATQDNGSGNLDAPAGAWSLGGAKYIDNKNLDGGLAEIGWWDRVLTTDERAILAKHYSPRFIPNGLKFAPDLIRNQRDIITGQAGTLDGTDVRKHPRIIVPVELYVGKAIIQTWDLSGQIEAQSAISGDAKSIEKLVGSLGAQSAISGDAKFIEKLVGIVGALSTLTGNIVPITVYDLAGLITAQSSLTGNIIVVYVSIPPFMEKDLIDPFASGAWLWLVQIAVPGQTTQRLARNTGDVNYGGDDFEKFNLQIGEQMFSSDGSIPRVTLKVFQDVNRKVEDIINATEGALGAAVELIRVNEKWLDSPVSALEADYDNLAAQSDSEWVTFTLGIPNPLTQRFPLRMFSSSMCSEAHPDLFKGPACQYDGEDVTCTGSYEDCYTKGNAVHWGVELGLDLSVTRGNK